MVPAEAHEVATRLPVVVHQRDLITVFEVGGELDPWTAPALCSRVGEAVEAGTPALLVDLSELQMCDQQGLRALAGAIHEARRHQARISVLRPALPDVAEAFDEADLLEPLPVAADAEQALRDLG
jgi:anti-anti-sigma factor